LSAEIRFEQARARLPGIGGFFATAFMLFQAPLAHIAFSLLSPVFCRSLTAYAKALYTARCPAPPANEVRAQFAIFGEAFVTLQEVHSLGRGFIAHKSKGGDGFLQRIVASIPDVMVVDLRRKQPQAFLSKGVHYPRL
jgi:hypothetical protein